MALATRLIIALAVALVGCTGGRPRAPAATVVCFDRGALGLAVGDLGSPLRQACAKGLIDPAACQDLEAAGRAARRAIITPSAPAGPTSEEAIVHFLGTAAGVLGKLYGVPVAPLP